MSVGENIKRLRRDKGWTQGELANKSKLGINLISKIEKHGTDIKSSTIHKLMDALNCNADMLLLDSEKTNMNTILKAQFERAAELPEENQKIVIDLIDKYCKAIAFEGLLKENGKNSILWMKGKTGKVMPDLN
jgi:transcriptional regulator with XRE-family HTH domain